MFLGASDTDIGAGSILASVRYFCSDYPNLKDSIRQHKKEPLESFISDYNAWKLQHPDSKSFYENSIHHKPRVNFKTSILYPAIGLELGISRNLSLNTMFRLGALNEGDGWSPLPYFESQFRYYHNIDKRMLQGKRTYKYSGNYLGLVDYYYPEYETGLVGLIYGWQRVVNKHVYYNICAGAGYWTNGYPVLPIIFNFDFGFNF